MPKKYIVRLTAEERNICHETIRRLKGSGERAQRARILLKADADGPAWTDRKIAEAFSCPRQTIEKIRRRFVEGGFERALKRKRRKLPPRPKILDGEAGARVISLYQGRPPEGYANWSLRLLAGKAVELGIVDSISHETVRQTLKRNGFSCKREPRAIPPEGGVRRAPSA